MESKEKLIEKLFAQGVLVTKEMMNQIESDTDGTLIEKIRKENNLLVVDNQDISLQLDDGKLIDSKNLDTHRIDLQTPEEKDLYQSHLQNTGAVSLSGAIESSIQTQGTTTTIHAAKTELKPGGVEVSFDSPGTMFEEGLNEKFDLPLEEEQQIDVSYQVVVNYAHIAKKYKVKDFAGIFKSRYKFLEKIIRAHPEMKGVTSISRVLQKKEKEDCAIIGVVYDIALTRNNNYIITVEDLTGHIKVIVSQKNKAAFAQAQELIFDEVIGISGSNSGDIMFASEFVWPDVPNSADLKKAPKEEYAIFLSDIHVGSNNFLDEEFQKCMNWLKAETGSDAQKDLANKVKYIFIAGDLIDGIGIYPNQHKELTILDMKGQYDEFTRFIKQIPKDKKIFICPGNHDLVHLAEPQSVFYKEYTEELHAMENVELVSNPSTITIAKTPDFGGINVLMYHGYSFDYYVANVDSIRNNGGYNRADLIMKFLLKRGHLAPAFKSTPYLPAYDVDPLLITKVPDIMISGHIHYSSVANYKAVTMICGSCWQSKTDFQEKLGHNPEPGRVPVVNLKTREVRVLRFV